MGREVAILTQVRKGGWDTGASQDTRFLLVIVQLSLLKALRRNRDVIGSCSVKIALVDPCAWFNLAYLMNVSVDRKLVIVIHILRLRPFVINLDSVYNLSANLFVFLEWNFLGLGEIFKLDLFLRCGRRN